MSVSLYMPVYWSTYLPISIFPLTLAHSLMVSRHCQQVSHFLKYLLSLESDILQIQVQSQNLDELFSIWVS